MFNRTCIVIIVALIVSSCGEVEKPLEETPPDTNIVSGPGEGSTITEPSVTFEYTGSNKLVSEFSYRYSPIQENWSKWSPDKSVKLEYLDQGKYVFEVKGRYESGNEDTTPDQRSFIVDIPGPGMLLKPFKRNAAPGEEFKIEVVADEVGEDVLLAHLILKFEPALLQFLDAAPGEFFQSSSPPVLQKTIDNSEGIAVIDISTITAQPPRIKGTGIIAAVRFRSLSAGKSNVSFDDKSKFEDSTRKTISIVNRIGSVVEITE